MAKQLKFDESARKALLVGVEKMSNAVKKYSVKGTDIEPDEAGIAENDVHIAVIDMMIEKTHELADEFGVDDPTSGKPAANAHLYYSVKLRGTTFTAKNRTPARVEVVDETEIPESADVDT